MNDTPLPSQPKWAIRNPWRLALSIAGLLVLLSGGCIALLVRRGTASYTAAKANADDYLKMVEAHNFADARGEMTDQAQSEISVETISDVVAVAEKRRGKMLRHDGPVAWRENDINGTTFVQLSYREVFAHGATTVTLVMKDEDGFFRAQSLQFSF